MIDQKWLAISKTILKIVGIAASGILLVSVGGGIHMLNQKPDLSVWHTSRLDEEFTSRKNLSNFGEYLALEDRLFRQLENEVYAKIDPEEQTTVNRFHRGSLSDPGRWPTDWNRSFEWSAKPVEGGTKGGVLLIHGLSDSPYSLRTIGRALNEEGFHILGLRVPGHGTAPSGLARAKWQDMAAAVQLAMLHLRKEIPNGPLHLVGYSNGGALALHYTLATVEDPDLPRPDQIVLISPEIGISPAAALAIWQKRIGRILGLEKLAWNDVQLEYDPFKYSSFPVNAGDLAYRLTTENRSRLRRLRNAGKLDGFPPVLAFQSEVDATVTARALVTDLFALLPEGNHELVVFGLNREAHLESLFTTSNLEQLATLEALRDDPSRTYHLSVVTNVGEEDRAVLLRSWAPGESQFTDEDLGLTWPGAVYSLSHISLPFPETDPLYGGEMATPSPGVQLGNIAMRGEKNTLHVSAQDMLRLRWNPFYSFLEKRLVEHLLENRP